MTRAKVLVHVEGQTEEQFVKKILQPHFSSKRMDIIPVIVTTKVVKSGPNFKGGLTAYEKVKKELQRLLGDPSSTAVTTMFDFYGLPNDFPGRDFPQGNDCYEKVSYVEKKFKMDINNPKLIPYLQLHEFESLLFSSPRDIASVFPGQTNIEARALEIRNPFNTPEEINDNEETCPSRRLRNLCANYKKPLHGSLISSKIGLSVIRKECRHFDKWLTKLESLI